MTSTGKTSLLLIGDTQMSGAVNQRLGADGSQAAGTIRIEAGSAAAGNGRHRRQHTFHRGRVQRLQGPGPLAPFGDEAGRAENLEMLGDCRLGHAEDAFKLTDAELAAGQGRNDAKPGRLGEGAQSAGAV